MREEQLAGLAYLDAVTKLLDRVRTTHPTAGLYDAAELQWWWGQFPRPTDDFGQLFWIDEHGHPAAAAIITDWRGSTQLDPLVLPDATPDWVTHVMERGLEHARESGFDVVTLEVGREDEHLRQVLTERGFAIEEDGLVESWLEAASRPEVSQLSGGYQLLDRALATDRPHHMINERRDHTDPEPRLRQTSLYRPGLDLVVYDGENNVGAYGLFWYNPTTEVGVVEPMRTNDGHQQRGLARHILTIGIDRLVDVGARRVKVCFDPNNAAARNLYLSVGFEPHRENDVFVGTVKEAAEA